ncbi:MAG: YbaB/EbfC family nucleoid-associated protein [Selenomonadaceae bacterium]|nr:YbaB/EbfC family nucleoid-associated protein [Selenomonadaceae bacterium]
MAQQGGFDLNAILRQAQALQKTFEENKAKIKQELASAQVGGGMVMATVDGEKVVKSIKIAPELVKDGDVSAIEDLVVSAVNAANAEMDKKISSNMSNFAGNALGGLAGLGGNLGNMGDLLGKFLGGGNTPK